MRKLCFIGCLLAAAQVMRGAPFQNLGFDDANTNNLINGIWGKAEDVLPGWRISPTQNFIGVDANTPGSGFPKLLSSPPAEGRFLLDFFGPPVGPSGPAGQWTLSQTGDIPDGAQTIHFISTDAHVSLTLSGTDVPLRYVPRTINPPFELNDVFGDVSAFAGQTAEMAFTTIIIGSGRPLDAGLDSIAFDVPEPPPWALFVLGGTVAAAALSNRWRVHDNPRSVRGSNESLERTRADRLACLIRKPWAARAAQFRRSPQSAVACVGRF